MDTVDTIADKLEVVAGAIGGVCGWYFGGMDGLFYALVAFTVVDYITGVMAAAVERRLSSSEGLKGIAKKVAIFALIGVMNVLDTEILRQGSTLRTAFLFFFIANEGLSIIENAEKLGIKIPEFIKKTIHSIKEQKE